jgi:uncharacterized membrane protein
MQSVATPIKSKIVANELTPGSARDYHNVAGIERWASLIGGGLLGMYGLRRGNWLGLGLATLGGFMIERGLTGHCALYRGLGISTKKHGQAAAVGAGRGFKVTRAVTIQRSAQDLYNHWREFDNLPHFMHHLVSVRTEGDRSHWIASAPAGMTVEWDAEIVNDELNRLIAWRSLSGSQVATAGSVHFTQLSYDRGTEVRVTLKYDVPGGALSSWLAWMFGEDPDQQIREDLRRFKQWMEAGEFATMEGRQPAGR